MATNVKTVPASALVLDYAVYPRHDINDDNLRSIARAIQAGTPLPVIVVEAKTNRVVDGWHRVKATLRVLGVNANITAEYRTYPDEATLLEEAIRLNAGHGARLTRYDQARCSILAEEMGLSEDRLAGALHLTLDSVRDLKVKKTALAPTPAGQPASRIPIKATLIEMHGQQLSERQVKANDFAGGMTPRFYVNQVINLLEGDLIDESNEQLMGALKRLASLLEQRLAAVA
jgi:hypothetical protein